MSNLNEQSKGLPHEGYVIRRITKDCFIATPENSVCFYQQLETIGGDKYDPIEMLEKFKQTISQKANDKEKMQSQSRDILNNENPGSDGVRNYTPLPNMQTR